MNDEELIALADAFRHNTFEIETLEPNEDNIPENLPDPMKEIDSYNAMFKETTGGFNYIAIRFMVPSGTNVHVPIAVFGKGESKKVRFPLIMNGSWFAMLTTDKNTFQMGLGVGEEECPLYFSRFVDWKRNFIEKIFDHYLQSEYCSAMCWEVKEKSSNTRKIAEQLGFYRIVFDNQELYTSKDITNDPEMINYFTSAFSMWLDLNKTDKENVPPQGHKNTVTLFAKTVGYEIPETIKG
ncbi:hypothetical protein LVD17_07230 [Fulvivirga ulvae]|uniref:hypothetical protein n=1 Tax=Fulvivirga ulvae TaxID=2904245 RepID=UPI001F2EA6BF|nr:hypothetical protein [Fulvivirga ulvae]UII33610.1 hypothetical protein LVD17_07230 [Fulvivirga ulvae]